MDAANPVVVQQSSCVRRTLTLNRVYEALARKRPLTLHMIRRIHKGMGIPAEVLISRADKEMLAA